MSYLLIALGIIPIHGLFVAAEYAFVKVAGSRNRSVLERTHAPAELQIWQNLEEYLQVCNIGKTVALISMGACLGLAFDFPTAAPGNVNPAVQWSQVALVILIFGFAQLIIGFEIPKLLGITKSDRCYLVLSGFLSVSRRVFYPIVWMLKQLTNLVR